MSELMKSTQQETEFGLELEREEADVRDLVDVPHEGGGRRREVLQVGGMARHAQVGVSRENCVACSEGDDLRALRPSKPGHDQTAKRLGRVGEGHGHEGRAYPGRTEVAPKRRTSPACGVLEPAAPSVWIPR